MTEHREIRVAALNAAVRYHQDSNADEGVVIKTAQDFARYIQTGRDRA